MENGVGPGKSLNLPNNLLLDQPLHWFLWHQWFSGQNGAVVFVAPVFHRPQLFNGLCAPVVFSDRGNSLVLCGSMVSRGFQWLIGSCGQTVVFSGRSNSLAPVAQVVLWFPAPVVNGRGNSLVLWPHGFPWFPVVSSGSLVPVVRLWCGAVAQVCSVWSSGSMDLPTPSNFVMLGMAQGNAPASSAAPLSCKMVKVDPTPSWCSKPTQFLECRGTTNPVDQVQWYRTPHQLPEA